jgi:hypothetical protein
MEKDVFPRLGTLALANITAPMVLARGGLETVRKLSECIGQVFRYGIATGR